jgi:exodeoxyribonuclease V gamma subunit
LRIEPMMQLLAWLLSLPTAEVGLSDWHAMFELEAVRARFKLDEQAVAQLYQWLSEAGVRWGLDAEDRSERHQLPHGVAANSWLFGLERLLLGYATGETTHSWQSILPLAAASGSSAEGLGALVQWIQAIRIAQQLLTHELTPAVWVCYLEELLQLFFDGQQDLNSQRWLSRFRQGLTHWLSACELAGFQQKIPLSIVAKAWLDNIDDNNSLQRPFLSGGVQFATLMPMRAIPFKVICLIGMNERDYPRQQTKQDFDLMASSGQWRAGDRSRRYDDRYLFLEAVLSARQQLYLSWTGRSIRDDQPRAPSVLVSQFIDYCHQLWTPELTMVQHPLQPFSRKYVQPDSHLQSYAVDWLSATNNQLAHQKDWSSVVLTDHAIPNNLSISRLSELLRYPQRVLLGHRLGIRFAQPQEVLSDDESFQLTNLDEYKLFQQQIDHWLATEQADCLPWQFSGVLPLAGFAQHHHQQLKQHSEQLWQAWHGLVAQYPHRLAPMPLALTLSGTHLHGQIELGYSNQQAAKIAVYFVPGTLGDNKSLKAYKLIQPWLSHCLAHAVNQSMNSHIIAIDAQVVFQPIEANQARCWLQSYVELYQQAWHQPLKVSCKSGMAYVQNLLQQQANAKYAEMSPEMLQTKALDAARNEFDGGYGRSGEWQQSLELQRCFQSFDALQPDFCDLAQRLYGLMLERIMIL